MSSIKPLRSLRCSNIACASRVLGAATRAIASTTKNSTSLDVAPTFQPSGSVIPRDLQSNTRSKFPPPIPSQNDFNNLLRTLTGSLTSTPAPHLPTLTSLLRAYTSNPAHWSRYAHANPKKQYTRNLVCEVPGIFNLLLLVWTPGKQSPIHNHAEAHCLMKVLQGSLAERRFRVPDEGEEGRMEETSKVAYHVGKVTYMSDALGLHEIGNPSLSDYAVSLHLYTPPNAAMRGCYVYDVENGESKHVMQGLYDSVGGVPTGV